MEIDGGVEVVMDVRNNSGVSIIITRIEIHWPQSYPENQVLEHVRTNGIIWLGEDDESPSIIDSFIGSESLRQIQHNTDQHITFRFKRNVSFTGYQITIDFDNGCSVTATK